MFIAYISHHINVDLTFEECKHQKTAQDKSCAVFYARYLKYTSASPKFLLHQGKPEAIKTFSRGYANLSARVFNDSLHNCKT